MKTYRQREKQGSKVQDSNKGPDEAKIKVNSIALLSKMVNNLKQVCSSGDVFVFVCVSGFVGADRIHPGCHHRAEKIWRSST